MRKAKNIRKINQSDNKKAPRLRTHSDNLKSIYNKKNKLPRKKPLDGKSAKPDNTAVSNRGTRLQKYIAECGLASRRGAEQLIIQGRVKVNGKVANKLGTCVDPDKDLIVANGIHLKLPEKGALIFYKPKHVISTMSDPEGRPCVADYIPKDFRSYFPIGRLDWDSSGLIVLTNDGELGEKLMHPRFEIERTYTVKVEGVFAQKDSEKAAKGIKLVDGIAAGKVWKISNDGKNSWLEITVKEGRNRMVRRMMNELGHPVVKLRRIIHGPFSLGKLQPGEVRKLTKKEFMTVKEQLKKSIKSL